MSDSGAFQYLAILHEDRVTGMKNGKRDFGLQQIELRCRASKDARRQRQPDSRSKRWNGYPAD
ncbi:MAG: hypothetical protein PHP23_03970 [Desulfobacterales bacterium]|nr:hypothetical protein [Desulfobacterales bacterium]MDD4392963.1 hypothetical protein [Desulfobacterales bacterium]